MQYVARDLSCFDFSCINYKFKFDWNVFSRSQDGVLVLPRHILFLRLSQHSGEFYMLGNQKNDRRALTAARLP